jgi:hypothetical protein
MENLFDYVPHPRLEKLKTEGPPTTAKVAAKRRGPSKIAQINGKIGLKITLVVGTMWTAYLFTALALVSAPSAFKTGNTIIIVAWIAQTFLQLVLLPIIIVGQNVQAAAADSRAQATYEDAKAILEEATEIQKHLLAQDDILKSIIGGLKPTK